MSVDRSYSPYEVIRAYHDRGMMKWGAFATGELTEAQNTFEKDKKDDKKIQALPHPLPHHVVLHLLNQSFSNQVQIKVKYQSKDKLNEVYGFVSEFINNQVRLKSTDKIHLISIEQIINIYSKKTHVIY
ncbi:hypothetical protein [Lactococcus formosensis]|uniref:hypothetical protein n=1 Tax=Lactococcus formosensis TaxID=1281486 RepID=UPI00243602F5|nr:hypothetical protein [Lactococcus formosensis]MDG6125190.1 hypothetical protein [Lactococcus formosensis]